MIFMMLSEKTVLPEIIRKYLLIMLDDIPPTKRDRVTHAARLVGLQATGQVRLSCGLIAEL